MVKIFQSETPLTVDANSTINYFDIPYEEYDEYVAVMATLIFSRSDYVLSRGCNITNGNVRIFPVNMHSEQVTCYPMVGVLYAKNK